MDQIRNDIDQIDQELVVFLLSRMVCVGRDRVNIRNSRAPVLGSRKGKRGT